MKLTKTATQAALAMAFLAGQPENQPTQARQVAKHLQIPIDSALKVLQALSRQTLLISRLGRHGGYVMPSAPDAITLLQVVEAIDGPIVVEMSFDESRSGALASPRSALESVCRRAVNGIRRELLRVTVADLVPEQALPHPIPAASAMLVSA